MDYGITPVFYKNYQAFVAKNENGKRKYKYIINTGSSRSSKTYSIIELVHRICENNSNFRVTAWRDTKKDARDTIWKDFQKVLSISGRMEYSNRNKTESTYYYPDTNTYFEVHGTDDEEKVHGLTQNVSWINEPYKISQDTFNQIDMRSDLVIIDWNPKKSHWIDNLSKQDNAIVIHSTFKDNPFCPEEQRIKILSYQTIAQSEASITGLVGDKEAVSYNFVDNPKGLEEHVLSELFRCVKNESQGSADSFNWAVYGLGTKGERPERVFKWTEINYAQYLNINSPVYYGSDWGAVDPFGLLEAKYYDGCLYLHELNYMSENEWRAKMSPSELSQILSAEEGFVSWLFHKLNIKKNRPIVCDNNRPLKIMALRNNGWDFAISANKTAGSICDGVDILKNLKVYYTHTSTNIAYEQENFSHKKDRLGVMVDDYEDRDNHLIDPARYIALFLQQQGIIKSL